MRFFTRFVSLLFSLLERLGTLPPYLSRQAPVIEKRKANLFCKRVRKLLDSQRGVLGVERMDIPSLTIADTDSLDWTPLEGNKGLFVVKLSCFDQNLPYQKYCLEVRTTEQTILSISLGVALDLSAGKC